MCSSYRYKSILVCCRQNMHNCCRYNSVLMCCICCTSLFHCPVTRFARVRELRVVMGDKLTCSCGFFERHGFPCRHMYMALREIRVTDFDVRWHLRYFWDYGKEGCQAYTDAVDHIRGVGKPLYIQYNNAANIIIVLSAAYTFQSYAAYMFHSYAAFTIP